MERRQYQRRSTTVRVRLECRGNQCRGTARDISSRGIFVELEQGCLAEDARQVNLHFEIDTGEKLLSRQLHGKVIRNDGDGLAVRFADYDLLGRAVVHELMFHMQCDAHERTDFKHWDGHAA